MTERNVPVRELIDLLPDLPEFDPLRQALHRESVTDSAQRWAGHASYETVDSRVISMSVVGALVMESENSVRRRVKRLYDGANIAFSAIATGAAAEKAEQLIALGSGAESMEQWRDALAYYLLAHGITRSLADLGLRALVLRRVGRAALNTGDLVRAAHYYATSLATASTATDAEGQLISATGLGNVCSLQGRWPEAEEWYARAQSLCGAAFNRERGQLFINRSMAARERNDLVHAHALLEEARVVWADLTPPDRAGWHNNMGLLLLEEQDLDGAEAAFMQALEGEPGHFHKAMVLDNLAEVAVLRGALDLAEARCRDAEASALAHGSPRALAEIYVRLGRVAAQRRDPNGVTFFEKALEVTHEKRYPLLAGEIYYEYARFRSAIGDPAAARDLLASAMQIFAELGATTSLALVEKELSTLG